MADGWPLDVDERKYSIRLIRAVFVPEIEPSRSTRARCVEAAHIFDAV